MRHEVRVPDLGDAASEAFVAEWYREPGDALRAGEELLELITDKANVAVDAPVGGRLVERCVASEARVEVGALLAVIDDGA